ncbi:twin-arginine translocase TatA/TatE family subunit [Halalkalicoccus tibetensis]|uniref:Twin-arginine translocase TatA/TatE family subunit n=1 Tax=Halalkalicoccus tibetensis TaxID=175632 RepID=A0ABD5V412_9EURY
MTVQFAPLFGPIPGGIELAVIVLIAILLFGANKIPKLARSTGQAMGEFQKGREEIDQELKEMRDGATQTEDEPEPEIGEDEEPEIGADEPTAEMESDTGADLETETSTETDENR